MSPKQASRPIPFHGGNCYACDAAATGYRDRRPEGGDLERACDRHREPSINVYEACIFCNGRTRKGSLDIDGSYAHASCAKVASA